MAKGYNTKSAIKDIQTQIKKIGKLSKQYNKSSDHTKWLLDTYDILKDIFGEISTICQSFVSITWTAAGRSFVASHSDYEHKMAQLTKKVFG